jgi:hypothetical protein
MGSRSYVLGVLRALHDSAPNPLDAKTILANLEHVEGSPILPRWDAEPGDPSGIESLLAELRDIGVVSSVGEKCVLNTSTGDGRSSTTLESLAPPDPPRGGDFAGDSGNGGGSGIGEVLAHKLLFSLSKADYESAVDHVLSGEG